MKINKIELSIQGAYELTFPIFKDDRGEFSRIFCKDELASVIDLEIKQINLSTSYVRGTIRGLHWQMPPSSEMKVVQCIQGEVFDVIVDLRKDSTSYLSWIAVELSKQKHNALVIPQGCAHGFQTLSDDVQMLYYHTENFNPKLERCAHYASEVLSINWPSAASVVSDRDKSAQPITSSFLGYDV